MPILYTSVIILKKLNLLRDRLSLSHLIEGNFKHNFQDSLNLLYNCGHGIQFTAYFFSNERYTVLGTLNSIGCNLLNKINVVLKQLLLFGNLLFNCNKKLHIFIVFIDYVLSTKRFDEALF